MACAPSCPALGIQHRLLNGNPRADQNAVAIDAFAGETIEAFRDIEALDFEDGRATGTDLQGCSATSQEILRIFIPMALNGEPDGLIHQTRFIKSDNTVAVGVVGDFVCRAEFDQGYTTARVLVHYDYLEVVSRSLGGAGWESQRKQNRNQQVVSMFFPVQEAELLVTKSRVLSKLHIPTPIVAAVLCVWMPILPGVRVQTGF